MELSKQEVNWIKQHEQMIEGILLKRIDDLKDQILEVPDEKREKVINFLKEYKIGLGFLREICNDKKSDDFTGI